MAAYSVGGWSNGCPDGKPRPVAVPRSGLLPRRSDRLTGGLESDTCIPVRSSRLSRRGLKDVPVHPTPLYAILCSMFTALIVWRGSAALRSPKRRFGGVFLMLNGLGRLCRGGVSR